MRGGGKTPSPALNRIKGLAMKSSTFAFTVFVSMALLGFCAFLFPSALDLFRVKYDADVGPGLVPMICLVGVAGLTIYTLILDILKKRHQEAAEKRELEDGELDRSFMGIACASILLMAIYAVLWAHTNFILASLVFSIAMACLCLPPEKRNLRAFAVIATFLSIFVVGVWAVFVKLLGVNLG